jgi:hypothetical protein
LTVGAAVIWRRLQAARDFLSLVPGFQEAMGGIRRGVDEAGRGLADGGAVSAKFVSDLRAGRWHEAYQSTSRRFRQRMDAGSFKRFVKESPPIKGPVPPIKFFLVFGAPSVTVSGAESAPKGGVWLLLVGEEGALKVDRLALGERTAP